MSNQLEISLWNGWVIGRSYITSEPLYYIVKHFYNTNFYLHKDGTVHDLAGPGNF